MRAAQIARVVYPILAVLSVSCSKQESGPANISDTAAAHAAVDSVANRLLAGLRTDNADSVLSLMTNDVIIMPPNENVLNGKAAVKAWYEAFVKQMQTQSLTVSNRELFVGGDYATEVSQFEWVLKSVEGGPIVKDRGSYMQLYQRQPDGRWLFSREVWNSMAPQGK